MSVRPIIPSIENNNNPRNSKLAVKNDVSFQGANPIVTVMDAVDRYGFAGTFILQDFLGMAGPRTLAGVTRNHDKTGEYNWDFARREGTREILSGPSAFLIPATMLPFIKGIFGSANNVPIDFINGFGQTAVDAAKTGINLRGVNVQSELYTEMFKNILSTSTDGLLKGEELENVAKEYSQRLTEIQDKTKSPKKSFISRLTGKVEPNSRQDKLAKLIEDYSELRKKYLGVDVDSHSVLYKTEKGTASASLKSTLKYMKDYSKDVIKSVEKAVNKAEKKAQNLNVEEFLNSFSKRRTGSRFLANMSMFTAVVLFYRVIPKLYNMGIKGDRDPGLDGLDVDNSKVRSAAFAQVDNIDDGTHKKGFMGKKDKKKDAAQPSFTGAGTLFEKAGGKLAKDKGIMSKFSNIFEFDGASMGPLAMLTLLFGFCLPPRLQHAKSDYEYKEIVVRDITSFISILFLGKALARGFAKMMTKKTGLVLSKNPEKHGNLWQKFKNYVSAISGIKVFDSPTIISKYSGLRNIKNGEGFSNFIEFIKNNGGNIKKVLGNIDENVAKATEKILGKPIKDATVEEITKAFKNAHNTHPNEMEVIYKAFDSNSNKFVEKAKTCNSFFNLVSNLVLVPIFMIGLAKYCERMTAKNVAQDNQNNANKDVAQSLNIVSSSQPTMKGFLAKAALNN